MGEAWIATANHLTEVESQQGAMLAVVFPLPLFVAASRIAFVSSTAV
jgi:hypothetical protein